MFPCNLVINRELVLSRDRRCLDVKVTATTTQHLNIEIHLTVRRVHKVKEWKRILNTSYINYCGISVHCGNFRLVFLRNSKQQQQ